MINSEKFSDYSFFLLHYMRVMLRGGEFQDAGVGLCLARRQDALSWELRAATGLARLRVTHDRAEDARRILAPVYERFTEGFDTADLLAAKQLLDG
jgi:predicted ATPase